MNTILKFENQKNGNGGFISLTNDIEEIGRLIYTIMPEKNILVISYVMVFPKFEGKGMGKLLVEEAIKFARENHWKIDAHCSYANSVLKRMENVEDVF